MGISKTELAKRDVFTKYEDVKFKSEVSGGYFMKNNGKETPIEYNNKLFNDSLLYGDEVTAEEYNQD